MKPLQVAVLNSHVIMFSNSTVGVVDSLEEQQAGGSDKWEYCEVYS